jgi:hypothetical protein
MKPNLGGLRVIQSLEIDETDAEYQHKKHKAQQTLKSAFESIFEKYSNVADDETDVVDLNSGKIIVDNGHVRSMAKDAKARDKWVALGEIILDDAAQRDETESEDELAEPAMTSTLIRRKAPPLEAVPAESIPSSVRYHSPKFHKDALILLG